MADQVHLYNLILTLYSFLPYPFLLCKPVLWICQIKANVSLFYCMIFDQNVSLFPDNFVIRSVVDIFPGLTFFLANSQMDPYNATDLNLWWKTIFLIHTTADAYCKGPSVASSLVLFLLIGPKYPDECYFNGIRIISIKLAAVLILAQFS